jgi:hypothetical protein
MVQPGHTTVTSSDIRVQYPVYELILLAVSAGGQDFT